MYRTINKKQLGRKRSGKEKFRGGSEKKLVLELRWRRAADSSRGGVQPPEANDCRTCRDNHMALSNQWLKTFQAAKYTTTYFHTIYISLTKNYQYKVANIRKNRCFYTGHNVPIIGSWEEVTVIDVTHTVYRTTETQDKHCKIVTSELAMVTNHKRHCHMLLSDSSHSKLSFWYRIIQTSTE